MLDQIVDHIAKQLGVIQSAPLVFFTALAVAIVVIWRIFDWRYAAKDDLINLYKAKLDGATPDEARARIERLEGVIRRTVGSEWAPLTKSEVQNLSREVASIEKRRIQVMYLNAYGKDLAQSIADAFEAAGWDVPYSMGSGFEDGLFVGRSPTVSPAMKAAIERSTSLKAIYMPPTKDWGPDNLYSSVFVAVGTNPA
jgi:hypothetical protein